MFRYAASNIPEKSKVEKGGEDAWFAALDLLAVADGVGGWASRGIDSGLYSKRLLTLIYSHFHHDLGQELRQILVDSVRDNRL